MQIHYFYQPVSNITKLAIGIKEVKVDKKTKYQHVMIADLYEYGLSLILDDLIQVAQADEIYYHEPLVHPALFLKENPEKVMIIGGGDGCAAREVLKHNIDLVKLIDIDGELVEICKEYLKEVNKGSLGNPKVEVIIEDGKEYVKKEKENFDCVILDLTDPFGPEIGRELYSKRFYERVKSLLKKDGVLVTQAGTAFYFPEVFEEVLNNVSSNFKYVSTYENWVPSFGYSCCFILASDFHNPLDLKLDELNSRIKERKVELKFYNPLIHEALFKKGLTRTFINSNPL